MRTPAVLPTGAGHAAHPGPAHHLGRPSTTVLALLCAAACILPPPLLALIVGVAPTSGLIALVMALSAPTYVAFLAVGRAVLCRQPSPEDAHLTWVSLKWDLVGGTGLLNASFLEYLLSGPGVLDAPVQMVVVALTDAAVFLVGAGCVQFVRGQILRRRSR